MWGKGRYVKERIDEETAIKERQRRIWETSNHCSDCAFYGMPVGVSSRKVRGGVKVVVHECALHPKCMNTVFSCACGDYRPRGMI